MAFSGDQRIRSIGVSISAERVYSLLRKQRTLESIRPAETQVDVPQVDCRGDTLLPKRTRACQTSCETRVSRHNSSARAIAVNNHISYIYRR